MLFVGVPVGEGGLTWQGIDLKKLLDTPITDADGVAQWTDSICNASVPLPQPVPDDTISLPTGGNAPGAYFLEVRGYHPEKVAASLSIPIAILQGERDYQVTFADDFAAWKAALGKRRNVTLYTYPDANHLFLAGTGPSTPAEYARSGHVGDKVIDDLAAWITALRT